MTVAVGIIPWALWILAFILLEGWGFRRNNDRWPTLSELVKHWEMPRQEVVYRAQTPEPTVFPTETKLARKAGLVTWTWRRWLVAGGLPLVAVVLELHWVWEVF